MLVPRNIIYPMSFFSLSGAGADSDGLEFCRKLASMLGLQTRNIIPLGRARAGIFLLVKNSISGARRKVIMSPHTIPDVINMVRLGGGEPVFVDVVQYSTNIDIDHLGQLVDEKTACVLITHYHVCQQDMLKIHSVCKQYGAYLFDDCAIALGANYYSRPVGTLCDASVFSFSGFKVLNYYWGGAIVVPDGSLLNSLLEEVEAWARMPYYKYFPQMKKVILFSLMTSELLYNYTFYLRRSLMKGRIVDVFPMKRVETTRLDNTICSRPNSLALEEWSRKFSTLGNLVNHRRLIASIYDQHFREIGLSAETSEEIRRGSAFANYPIVVGLDHRDAMYSLALQNDFDVGLSLYPNVHESSGYTAIPGRTTKVSDMVRSIISLPTHMRVTPAYATQLSEFISQCLKGNRSVRRETGKE